MTLRLTVAKGVLRSVRPSYLPGVVLSENDIVWSMLSFEPTAVLVHGFKWNPYVKGKDNPHENQWPLWAPFTGHRVVGLGWNSDPSFTDSWRNGHLHTYHYAWWKAKFIAAPQLRRLLDAATKPVNLVAHSLGTRVVMQAVSGHQHKVKRVLLLNGAESSREARMTALDNPEVEFFSINSRSDRILRYLGGLFTPGRLYEPVIGLHGIKNKPGNWHEVWLSDPRHRDWAAEYEWKLDGAGFLGFHGHFFSFSHPGNHGLYKAILNGDDLNIPAISA